MQPFEFHYTVSEHGSTPVAILSEQLSLSVSEIKSAITKGSLWHKKYNAPKKSVQRIRRFKKQLTIGDELSFYYNSDVLNQKVSNAILIEDCQDYSVWYKPYGMLSQGSKWSDHCTINRWVANYFNNERPCFIVHRLDRATAGLIIIAHNKKATKALGEIFEHHHLVKTYQAICHFDDISQHSNTFDKSAFTSNSPVNDKSAISHFVLNKANETPALALYEITIETGRKHQIRQHCASMKLPIVGDRLYGLASENSKEVLANIDLQLCAIKLSFTCPFSEQIKDYTLANNLQLNWPLIISQLSHEVVDK